MQIVIFVVMFVGAAFFYIWNVKPFLKLYAQVCSAVYILVKAKLWYPLCSSRLQALHPCTPWQCLLSQYALLMPLKLCTAFAIMLHYCCNHV